MDVPVETPSTSIVAPIGYIARLPKYNEEVPYYLLDVQPIAELPSTNIEIITKDVLIQDMRASCVRLSLEADGFQLFDWPQSNIHIESEYEEVEAYCRDMAKMVAKELGADEAFVFDFRFRFSDPKAKAARAQSDFANKSADQDGPAQNFFAEPVLKAHLDQTQDGGRRRLRLHLTEEEYSKYLSGNYRVRIVKWVNNDWACWRSFTKTAQDMPLAICNLSSIQKDDPMVIEIVELKRTGENYYLRYNKDHEWHWASNMDPSEVLVFTTWDSKETERTTNCAYHTAFPNPSQHTTPRTSLEVRTIIVNSLV